MTNRTDKKRNIDLVAAGLNESVIYYAVSNKQYTKLERLKDLLLDTIIESNTILKNKIKESSSKDIKEILKSSRDIWNGLFNKTGDSKSNKVGKRLRFYILQRDNFTCQYCGAKAPDVKLHVDHKTPMSMGGLTTEDNLLSSCMDCNLGKSNLYDNNDSNE